MKKPVVATLVLLAAINWLAARAAVTNAPAAPREGDIVPAPGPRDRAFGISGPGAKHTASWTNYNEKCIGSAVKEGLIPNLKPLIPDTQLRDTIVILGGDGNYYLTGSSGADIWDFNDGIELWRSPDLTKWDYAGEVWSFNRDGTWEKNWHWHRQPVRAIWAPEIHYLKRLKNYFITISMPPGNRGILKSTTGKPEGPYVNALANDGFLQGGIDGTIFEDDDGQVYFTSGGASTIWLMNDDLSGFAGGPHHVVYEKPADGSWTRSSIAMEGASLFKRNGIYYLGGAAFYKGRYSSVAAMSTNIFGPYKNWEEAVPCGGGTDYFQDKEGNWWDAYFGNDNQSPFREKPAIVKIDFAADGKIIVAKQQPDFVLTLPAPYILTPPAPATPRINSAKIFGVRPGSPFLFTIPATGDRPMKFSADYLPRGLKLNARTGRITGKLKKPGEFSVTLRAKNALGAAEEKFRILCGDTIALTPSMGWNSWNCFASAVSEDKVKRAADAMVKSGLINHGWTYINVDDCWQNHRNSKDPALRGPFRDAKGNIVPNSRFPHMKGLAARIHGLGLKAGLYSSPGPWTCGGCAGSWQHEEQDAKIYAAWGFDYLKYDWCSYGSIASGKMTNVMNIPLWGRTATNDAGAIYPYKVMGNFLRQQKRDIVFSLCQYGMADVWKWGAEVGGNCWRTTGDITDTWKSMSGIGFKQDNAAPFAGPGHWNDPDMLVVGQVGWGRPHPTRLTPDEQYTHISLWCLLSAPLLIGCDMEKLDDFTLSLLSNDEVLAVDQDSLGKQATCVSTNENSLVYEKDLDDGTKAVGLFNPGETPANVVANWSDLKISGAQTIRDLWRQEDLGKFENGFTATVAPHGVVLVKIQPAAK